MRAGRVVATALGAFVLFATLGFFLRTRAVLGPLLQHSLHRWAQRNEVRLEVGGMQPAGLLGIRLQDVRATLPVGGGRVRVDAESVDLSPSISALASGELAVGTVRIAGGDATLVLEGEARAPSPAGPASREDSEVVSEVDRTGPDPAPDRIADVLALEFRDVGLRLRVAGGPTTAPVEVGHAEMALETSGERPRIERAEGFGRFPGGVSFALSTRPADPKTPSGARRFQFRPEEPVSLGALLGGVRPADLEVGGIEACPGCRAPQVCAHDLDVERGDDRFASAGGCLRVEGGRYRLELRELEWRRSGREIPVHFTDLSASAGANLESARISAAATGPSEGRASLTAEWSRSRSELDVRFETSQFRLGPIWPVTGLEGYLSEGRLDGGLRARIDPTADLIEWSGDLGLRGLRIDHPFVAEEPIEVQSGSLRLDALSDLALEHVSLVATRFSLGGVRPVRIDGSMVQAGAGWAFEVAARADRVSAADLRDALPPRLALPALGATIRGRLDAAVHAAGHTSFPESLRLEVDVGGNARVLEESPRIDPPSLAITGPPGPAVHHGPVGEIPLAKWATLEGLPEVLPRVILAAEDVRFYRHPGFDWRGVRNAMVHNLKVGRLERGGSTISQQVAKNLFFTHRRTISRKIREVWATWRLESRLNKERILELYLNLVEWGPEVQGIREAARHYFASPAEELKIPQMALLGAILPGPARYGSAIRRGFLPSSRVEKVEHVLNNLAFLGIIERDVYRRMYADAKAGRIGGLTLTVCRDDKHAPAGAPECPYVSGP